VNPTKKNTKFLSNIISLFSTKHTIYVVTITWPNVSIVFCFIHESWVQLTFDKIKWFEGSVLERRGTLFVPNSFATPLCWGFLCGHIFACYVDLLKQLSTFINTVLIQHHLLDVNFILFFFSYTKGYYASNIRHQENQDELNCKLDIWYIVKIE